MKKLLLIFIMMATWMVVGCETVRQVKSGCYGYWMGTDAPKRGTIEKKRFNTNPYRQCVETTPPYKNTERRPFG